MSTSPRIIIDPTTMSAEGGSDSSGAKKHEVKKKQPTVTAASPVLPPSSIPDADSTKVVTGEAPSTAPMEVLTASTMKARVLSLKSPVSGLTRPANLAIAKSVPVVSSRSTYRKVKSASARFPPSQLKSSCPADMPMPSTLTTCLK
eukprot:2722116-Rhodomonas_salina.1